MVRKKICGSVSRIDLRPIWHQWVLILLPLTNHRLGVCTTGLHAVFCTTRLLQNAFFLNYSIMQYSKNIYLYYNAVL